MRDAEQENAFIGAFIVPERRARYRQLLADPRKRGAFLDRLNHALDFIPSRSRPIPGGQHSAEGVARLLSDRGMKDTDVVYVFSDVGELDGRRLPLRRALEEVIGDDFGS